MTQIDTDKLRALDKAWKREEEDAAYYGGPPSKHLPHGSALDAYLRNSVPAILAMVEDNRRLREALTSAAYRLDLAAAEIVDNKCAFVVTGWAREARQALAAPGDPS